MSLDDFSLFPEPAETGDTLAENALIKARAAFAQTGVTAIADDTGLEVDALGGLPGVRSARFAGPGADYAANLRLLLERLAEVADPLRTARFRCVVALVDDGREATFEGTVEGLITRAPRGFNGFGYDPVFFCPEIGKTFAEAEPEEKHRVSHRGRALRALANFLSN